MGALQDAEAAYADAIAQARAASAGGSPEALEAARRALAAASKALARLRPRKGRRQKVGPGGKEGAGAGAAAATRAPGGSEVGPGARLPGFGSLEYWSAQPDNPAWAHYPPPRELPSEVGPDGREWTASFSVDRTSEARAFWDEWGFVVFRDVISAEQCDATVAEMWDKLEADHPGVQRGDPDSHDLLPVQRYGLPTEQALFTPQLVRNRQSPRVYAAIDAIAPRIAVGSDAEASVAVDGGETTATGAGTSTAKRGRTQPSRGNGGSQGDGADGADGADGGIDLDLGGEPGPNSVVMSCDRWCYYPPSKGRPQRQTTNPGAHLDLCPWGYLPRPGRRADPETDIEALRYRRGLFDFRVEVNGVRGEFGPHNQGLLNLLDNRAEDGGTAVVPGFHKAFPAWSAALGRWEDNRVGQRRRGNAFVFANPNDPIHALSRRVTLRAGSLLLWNQCTAHCAVPNVSDVPRAAQFIRGFRFGEMSPARAAARAQAVVDQMRRAEALQALGPLAPHVFGLTAAAVAAARAGAVPAVDVEGPVGEGARWEGAWPRQLTADEATRFRYGSLFDLLPADREPFLLPAGQGADTRSPLTYEGLHRLARDTNASPALAGVPRGACVAAALPPHSPELATCFLALAASGAFTFAPLNPDLCLADAEFELRDLPASLLVVLAGRANGAAEEAARSIGIPVVELQPGTETVGWFTLRRRRNDVNSDCSLPGPTTDACAAGASRASDPVSRDDVALLMHTSGTTRRPKLVPLTHGQLAAGAICVCTTLQLTRQDLGVNVLPLFHLHGLMINVLVTAVAGAALVCSPPFDAPFFFRLLASPPVGWGTPPTWYSAVPTIHQEVLREAQAMQLRGGAPPPHALRLIRNCSAALAPSVAASLQDALPGARVVTSYAMTEAIPICSNPATGPHDLLTVGPPAGAEVKVVAPGDRSAVALAAGVQGEVIVRGPCVFRGYEAREHLGYDPNADALLPGGWLRTGDKGWFDPSGHLRLAGRFKEIVNRAGEKISPLAVEHALAARAAEHLPGVVSLLVFAAPHEELGEVPAVAVVCERGSTVSLAQVRRCGSKGGLLQRQWLPSLLVHLSSIPKGPTGKPARIGLATKLELPSLSLSKPTLTLDLRGGGGRPLEYEAQRRSEARKAAASRSSAVRRGARGGLPQNGGSTRSLEDCVDLVASAMAGAVGAAVGEEDDLFDAGLSSITATRLREHLAARTGLELPRDIIYDHTTVRSLAAAVYRAKQESEGITPVVKGLDMLAAQAKRQLRDGHLKDALQSCWQALQGPPLPSPPVPSDVAKVLPTLTCVQQQQRDYAAAAETLTLLLSATADAGAATTAMLAAQLHVLLGRVGDCGRAAAAAASRSRRDLAGSRGAGEGAAPGARGGGGPAGEEMVMRGLGLVEAPALGDAGFARLRVLDLSDNALTVVPASLGGLAHLRELVLAQNRLTSLPQALAALPRLEALNLQANLLARLPSVALRCPALRTLRWGHQRVDRHDPEAGDETVSPGCHASRPGRFLSAELRVLEMQGNGQDALPLTPAGGTALTAVLAAFNRIADLPKELSGHAASLKVLSLGCNLLSTPESLRALGALTHLTCLKLEGNALRTLPDGIGGLAHLRELAVYGNELAALPETLGRCRSLEVLDAHHNALTALPPSLAGLPRLKNLYLGSNRLRDLPALRAQVLDSLPALQNLALGANDLDLAHSFAIPGCRVGLGWNRGRAPPEFHDRLTEVLATTDSLYDPACRGARGEVLLVAFAGQGIGNLQWVAPCSAARSAGIALDALYLADPSNSYYLDDPRRRWEGLDHYASLIAEHAAQYERVLMVGSSMGGTGVLAHAGLAHRVLAFGPRVDLANTHGSYVPGPSRRRLAERIHCGLSAGASSVSVHVGSGNLEDVLQAQLVAEHRCVSVTAHDTFHHNVPMFLEREGLLVPLMMRELASLLLGDHGRHEAGAEPLEKPR